MDFTLVTKWLNDKVVYAAAIVYITGSYAFGRYLLSELIGIWPWELWVLIGLEVVVVLGLTLAATASIVKSHEQRTGNEPSSVFQAALFLVMAISCGLAWTAGVEVEEMVQTQKNLSPTVASNHACIPHADPMALGDVTASPGEAVAEDSAPLPHKALPPSE